MVMMVLVFVMIMLTRRRRIDESASEQARPLALVPVARQ